MKVGDVSINAETDEEASQILIDSGTSFVAFPTSVLDALEEELMEMEHIEIDSEYYWPCSEEDLENYPNITYYTRGIVFNLTARSYFYLSSSMTKVFFSIILRSLCEIGF